MRKRSSSSPEALASGPSAIAALKSRRAAAGLEAGEGPRRGTVRVTNKRTVNVTHNITLTRNVIVTINSRVVRAFETLNFVHSLRL